MNIRSIFAATAVSVGLATSGPALARDVAFPTDTVQLVVPFPAGGATDVLARLVANGLSERWGYPVVVENRPGATGAIAAEYVMNASPDGYTLLVGTASVNTVAPSLRDDLPFDTLADFEPISTLSVFPNVLVVNPNVAADTVEEFIELLRAEPDRYTYGSSGIGSSIHLTGELFQQMTSTEMLHIPYSGSAPARTDLLAGNIDVVFDNLSSVLPLVEEGRLKAIAVTGAVRDPAAPDVPTIAETVEGFDASSWIGLMAPIGTPAEIVEFVAQAAAEVVAVPEVTEDMLQLGLTPATSTPEEFRQFLADDLDRWTAVVQGAGITLD